MPKVYQIWMKVPFRHDRLYNEIVYTDKDEAQGICDNSKWPEPELYLKELELK